VTGISTFIANMFILAIAAVLWLVAIIGAYVVFNKVYEEIRRIR